MRHTPGRPPNRRRPPPPTRRPSKKSLICNTSPAPASHPDFERRLPPKLEIFTRGNGCFSFSDPLLHPRKMVGGVSQPKVRNLEKISKFLLPSLFTFFGRPRCASGPGHHATVASRRIDGRAPTADRRLHRKVARPTGIAPARLAHQRPVRRLSSSAQVPATAPTVPTRDGCASAPASSFL